MQERNSGNSSASSSSVAGNGSGEEKGVIIEEDIKDKRDWVEVIERVETDRGKCLRSRRSCDTTTPTPRLGLVAAPVGAGSCRIP